MVFGCIDYIANILPPHCPCVGSKGRAAGPQASGLAEIGYVFPGFAVRYSRSLNLTRSIRSNQPRARIRRPALTELRQKQNFSRNKQSPRKKLSNTPSLSRNIDTQCDFPIV